MPSFGVDQLWFSAVLVGRRGGLRIVLSRVKILLLSGRKEKRDRSNYTDLANGNCLKKNLIPPKGPPSGRLGLGPTDKVYPRPQSEYFHLTSSTI